MPLHGKLRFGYKVLVTIISLVGITAAYYFIAKPSESPAEGAQIVAIDDTPTASITHYPEERLAVEALAGRKSMPDSVQELGSKPANKTLGSKKAIVNKPKKITAAAHAMSSGLSQKKTLHEMNAKIKKLAIEKKMSAQSLKKAPSKNDPIAGLLAEH